ncbi:MAG: hypothetical protein DI544_00205 [Sphingomonas taxi]|uniref:OmpA-like domain-containing protein n=1 Tax=Sphingomonas taxi TaxID=1549858 RepID=A0A2W5PIT8_9SPHN|nr:MAG: hypothetical protein DI544_00205 [Sphingomonas taxi]
MIRPASLLVSALLLAGCDRPTPTPAPPEPGDARGFDNAAASRSIMQPRVIAESAPTPTPTPTPPAPTAATVPFARGATLDEPARAVLDGLLAAPGLPADARWVLRGSSDAQGSDTANLATARRRARAVRAYLVDKGVDAGRITVIALGDGRPLAPNVNLDGSDNPAGRARNRRVDVEILPPDPPAPAASDGATPDAD